MKGRQFPGHRISVVTLIILLLILAIAAACAAPPPSKAPAREPSTVPSPSITPKPVPSPAPSPAPVPAQPAPTPPSISPARPDGMKEFKAGSDSIGLAAGGAKDINNFRENIRNNYLPLPSDITYEGLFYDYYFDTGQTRRCNRLFCPSYSYAVTRDPFSGKTEYYLSVGLNSGMKERDFDRKKLNLVVVLDISGSMSSPFNEYYYDRTGHRVQLDFREQNIQKMEVAKDALISIMDQLNDDDRFGIVLFNSRAHLLQPLRLIKRADVRDIEDSIFEISPGGSTSLSSGVQLATDLLEEYIKVNPNEFENRMIVLTDAMPNTGEIGEYSLLRMLKRNADDRIYTTFVGIGVDFNTELTEYITKTKGANYYSVHSPRDFMERVDEEFNYMVTPLVFDLRLTLDSRGWDIEQVYGSPEADRASGELMKVNTLFPSKKEDGETRGGLILLKLSKHGKGTNFIRLGTTYETRSGQTESSEAIVYIEDTRPEYFENDGIRKGILLARYADLMKNWILDEREHAHWSRPWEPLVNLEDGIIIPPPFTGKWERLSLPLLVSPEYRMLFKEFSRYYAAEMKRIGDETLEQELDILESLSWHRD